MVALPPVRRPQYPTLSCSTHPGAVRRARDREAVSAAPGGPGFVSNPGQKGTRQLVAEYGDRLICVRYRYDAERRKRFKTVELVVAERAWSPPPSRFSDDAVVAVRVAFAETEVRQRVKAAG